VGKIDLYWFYNPVCGTSISMGSGYKR